VPLRTEGSEPDDTDPDPSNSERLARALAEADLVILPLGAILLAQQAIGRDGHLIYPLALFVLAWATINHSKLSSRVALGYLLAGQVAWYLSRGAWGGNDGILFAQIAFAGLFAMSSRLAPSLGLGHSTPKVPRSNRTLEGTVVTEIASPKAGALKPQNLQQRLSTLESGLEAMLDLARGSTEAHSVVMMASQGDGTYRIFVASSNEPLTTEAIPSNIGLLQAALAHQSEGGQDEVLRIHPLDGQQRQLPYMDHTPARIRSVMSVVVRRADGAVDGVLFFDKTVGPGFSDRDAARARRTAALVSRLLETEREVHAVSRQNTHVEHLLNAARVLAEAQPSEDSWDSMLQSASHLAPLRFGAMLVREGAGNAARIVSAYGENSGTCRLAHVDLESSYVGRAFASDDILPASGQWAADGAEPLFGSIEGPELEDGAPLLIIPFRARGVVLGCFVLLANHPYEVDEIASLRLLAIQATEAVLYSQILRDMDRRTMKDQLTGLDSRETVLGKLEESLARSQRGDFDITALMVDVDHLQRINDTHGEDVGDLILTTVAQVLDDSRRINDAVGRIGGDQFLLVLEDASAKGGKLVGERILQRVRRIALDVRGTGVGTTVSIGLATAAIDAKKGVELVQCADKALYRAKKQGRDRVVGIRDPKSPPVLAAVEPIATVL
jgi:diguanylate cyclase (GGDEF)-like protein